MSDKNPSDWLSNLLTPSTPLPLAMLPHSTGNPAKWMHERIVRSINSFEKDLDHDHEVGARLVSFGADLTFHIEDVGYWGPDIITFHGVDEDKKTVELIQHITQLSILLVAMDKIQEKPRRIGFGLMKEIEEKAGAER